MLGRWASQQPGQRGAGGPPPTTPWVLATGAWDDTAPWADTELWKDAP